MKRISTLKASSSSRKTSRTGKAESGIKMMGLTDIDEGNKTGGMKIYDG